jgi:hypothetical protein
MRPALGALPKTSNAGPRSTTKGDDPLDTAGPQNRRQGLVTRSEAGKPPKPSPRLPQARRSTLQASVCTPGSRGKLLAAQACVRGGKSFSAQTPPGVKPLNRNNC